MSTKTFNESDSDFYDLEYFLSIEWRYLSDAHRSRISHVLKAIGPIEGKRCLDVGCGGGFFVNEVTERGAHASGIDYAASAVAFANERFPHLDVTEGTGYDLSRYADEEFDVVLLLDVIEHMSEQERTLSNIYRVLKPGGKLIVATDVDDGVWSKGIIPGLLRRSNYFSADGRAYNLIKRVETARRRYKNYHASHVAALDADEIKKLLHKTKYDIVSHELYPWVGVPVRDWLLRLLPMRYRGDHQTIVAARPMSEAVQ